MPSSSTHFTGIGRRGKAPSALSRYRATDLGEHDTGEVDAVNGAFMLVRRPALEQVGLLDEGYWLYAEDLDWCYRFKQAGWRVLYDGRVSVVHVKGATHVHRVNRSRHRGLRENAAFHRSMGRFYRKFYDRGGRLRDLAIYLAIGVKLAIAVARSTVARRPARSRGPRAPLGPARVEAVESLYRAPAAVDRELGGSFQGACRPGEMLPGRIVKPSL